MWSIEVSPYGYTEGEGTAMLTFDSFDGGGPEYSISIKDPGIVSYTCVKKYKDDNHEDLDGAGYQIIYTFSALKPGKTKMITKESSPIDGDFEWESLITVDKNMHITIEKTGE